MIARTLFTFRTDFTVQVRNRLYQIGMGVAALLAAAIGWLATPDNMGNSVPVILLLLLGGSTLLYVAGMILFEKDEGTLSAIIVSPLTVGEYLISKIVTLTGLATLEGIVIVLGAALLMGVNTLTTFNTPVLLLGMLALGVIYTLVGIILVVRYESITDFLVPVLFIASVLQAPALHFTGLIESTIWYVVPSTAQVLIMSAAWEPLATWEWVYALAYTAVTIGVLYVWALRAFQAHIVMRLS